VVVHVAASATIDVAFGDLGATPASARDEGSGTRSATVERHVTRPAERQPVVEVESQAWLGGIGAYVMSGQPFLMLTALATAVPAAIPIASEDRIAPLDVRRVAESLPWTTALPKWMSRAAEDRAPPSFCL
jgi:hypothetical protein